MFLAVWAVLYGLTYSLLRLFFPAALPYAVLACAVLLVLRMGSLHRPGALQVSRMESLWHLRAHLNLRPECCVRTGAAAMPLPMLLILLLVLPAANLLRGGSFASGTTVVLLLGAAVIEEVFFRGFLLADPAKSAETAAIFDGSAFAQSNPERTVSDNPLMVFKTWTAAQPAHVKVLISAGVFAAFHAANVFGGQAWRQVVPQMICAFCAGLLFAAVTCRTRSLIPAVAGHFLINITASEAMRLYIDPGTGSMLVTVLIGIAGAAVYSLRTQIMKMKTRIGGGKVVDAECVPFAVFSDNKRYYDVFAPVLREMDQRGRDVLYLTASEDDPVFQCGLEHVKAEYIGPGNRVFTRLNNLKATVVLSTTPGLDVYQWKRSPGVEYYVHIPHAPSDIILYRMFGLDYYDAVLLSGKYQEQDVRALEELRGLPAKDIRIVGIPYMDEKAERLKREGPAPEHERTVLLAPSWGKSALFGVYGSKIIDVLLATGWHIIIRPHPQSFTSEKEMIEGLMAAYPDSDQIEWNRDLDNFDVLCRSDILVSDFSGVVFEFALIYDKPVIYTDPDFDLAPYDAWWLKDRELWTMKALPRLGRELTEENMEDIRSLIDECIEDTRFAGGRREVREETWEHISDGASLAADYLCEKYDALMSAAENREEVEK